MTDSGCVALVTGCPDLTYLNIAGCQQGSSPAITKSATVAAIATHCKALEHEYPWVDVNGRD
eukprot:gene42284-52426_t